MTAPNGFPRNAASAEDRDTTVLLAERIEDAPKPTVSAIVPPSETDIAVTPEWVTSAAILWERRRFLFRAAVIFLLLGLLISFITPKQYKSSTRIMPPSSPSMGTAMIAALAGRALGGMSGLSSLAGNLLGGGNNSTALFVDLLRSGTIADHLIDRFNLQRIYHKRFRVDTVKYLAGHTAITDDKKSGVITITVTDTDPRRARDIAQGYLDELNSMLNRTSTSSGRQERVFIEKRLQAVKADLEHAQEQMSEFSSTHATVDIKEQARALVDAASRLQAQMIIEQANLNSLRQVYGDDNVRVRATKARIGALQSQLEKMSGSSAPLAAGQTITESDRSANDSSELYPPLRQLPRLAVPYADLYREVRIQESVFELLTQQYELARIQEAKDVPVVGVIDAPGIPEKKSFPPRLTLAAFIAFIFTSISVALLLLRHRWLRISSEDPRKALAQQIYGTLRGSLTWRKPHTGARP
jgi:capsule polysaccharide export protein KpsE/RkpR